MPDDIVYYVKDNCHQCKAVRPLLDKYDLTYRVVNVDHDPAAYKELKDNGVLGVPVIRNHGTYYVTPLQILEFLRSTK